MLFLEVEQEGWVYVAMKSYRVFQDVFTQVSMLA